MIRLLRDLVPANVLALLITEAAVLVCCYVLAGFLLLDVDPVVYLLYDGGLVRILINVLIIQAALYFHDLYSNIRVRSHVLLLQQVLQVLGIAFIAQALLSYGSANLILPRWVMILGSGFALVSLVGWRSIYSALVLRAFGEERILFLGDSGLNVEIAHYLSEHPEFGMRAVGFISENLSSALYEAGLERLGGLAELREQVRRTRPDTIVVGLTERRGVTPMNDLLELRFSGIRIEEAASVFENTFKRVSLKDLRPGQLVYSGELGPRPSAVALQSAYSGLLALTGLVVTAPVMRLAALAVKLSSRGPVLYRQTRTGWRGAPFTLYKFRSMRAGAEADTGAVWASKNDPRVTRVGRLLRRARLDELPQLLNVLKGEMSLVGPRPERPEFVAELSAKIPFYPHRLCVRPGITGWAQINYHYGDGVEDAGRKLEYDLYYIKRLSPALDAFILFHTLKTVLLLRGSR